jgi:hypothetical protein
MARRAADEPKSAQVNVRLTDAQVDALATIEFLDGTGPAELIRALLELELAQRRDDPLFRRALQLRAEAAMRAEGRLGVLPSERSGIDP